MPPINESKLDSLDASVLGLVYALEKSIDRLLSLACVSICSGLSIELVTWVAFVLMKKATGMRR